jgi:hypothetical protein
LSAAAGDTQVSLTWTASSGASSYNIKRSTSNGGPYTQLATATTTSYTNTALTNGTTYYYVVSAVNPAGESANSAQASGTPQPASSVTYTTNFDGAAENPISEGGRWTTGIDIYQPAVQKSGGLAFGTQTGSEVLESPPRYNDSQAILSGFPPNHRAELTIHIGGFPRGDLEVEVLLGGSYGPLRNDFGPTHFNGVEINLTYGQFGVLCYSAQYLGHFADDFSAACAAHGVLDGDKLVGELRLNDVNRTGVVIVSMIRGGVETRIGTTPARSEYYLIGNPGIAFFRQNNGAPDNPSIFSATSYTARGL